MTSEQINEIKSEGALVPKTEEKAISTPVFDSKSIFNPDVYKQLLQLSNYVYSKSGITPQAFRGKPEDCFIALSMAMRMNIDPMMVMQNGYVVNGNFSWSGQACYALIENCGKFEKMHYVETYNSKTDFSCKLVAWSKELNCEVESDTVDYEMVKAMGWADKRDSYWNKMPRQMARYRACAFFARAHCPEALMGLYTAEERADIDKIYEEIEEEDENV